MPLVPTCFWRATIMRYSAFLLLALTAAAAAQDKPAAKIPVGKDTTIVLGPLTQDGYVDYGRIVNERLGKGIRPEDNAMASLVQAFGPASNGKPIPPLYFKMLGVAAPPANATYFIEFDDFYRKKYGANRDEVDEMSQRISLAAQAPWTAKDNPEIAAWIKSQQKQLAIIVEASKRSRFFSPTAVEPENSGPKSAAPTQIAYQYAAQAIRGSYLALRTRAMLKVSEGQLESAWQDLIACRRLARLAERSGNLSQMMIGISGEWGTAQSILMFLSEARLTDQQLKRCLADLRAISPRMTFADYFDLSGQLDLLDGVQLFHRAAATDMRDPSDPLSSISALVKAQKASEVAKHLARATIDWGLIFRDQVRVSQRFNRALHISERPQRVDEFQKLRDDLNERAKACYPVVKLINDYLWWLPLDSIRIIRSMGLALSVQELTVLVLPYVCDRYDSNEQIERNLYVAIALARFKLAQKRFPAKLAELVPRYLNSVPDDIFSSKQLIYKRMADGYLLYSVGVNGKDDGGKNRDDDILVDDICVRMPMPKPKN